jgi:hypothetical protein
MLSIEVRGYDNGLFYVTGKSGGGNDGGVPQRDMAGVMRMISRMLEEAPQQAKLHKTPAAPAA